MSTTAINVGPARAIVSRVTAPDDKTLLWHRQSNPTVNSAIGMLYYFDWEVGEWLQLKPDSISTQKRDVFTVSTNGQVAFTLSETAVRADLSVVNTIPGAVLAYGEHYSIVGNTLTLDLPYSLEIGEKVIINYYY
jgi:hypothetical protein